MTSANGIKSSCRTTVGLLETCGIGADVISISAQKKDIEMNVMIDEDQGKTNINLSLAKTVRCKPPDESEGDNFVPDKVAPPTDLEFFVLEGICLSRVIQLREVISSSITGVVALMSHVPG